MYVAFIRCLRYDKCKLRGVDNFPLLLEIVYYTQLALNPVLLRIEGKVKDVVFITNTLYR
jgi:hypothetical protein